MATDNGLSFTTRRVGDALILDHRGGGCRSATDAEIECIAEIERLRARVAELEGALEALPFIVQYRRKDGGIQWVDMAAFDVEGAAESYCRRCAGESSPWDYRTARRVLEGGKNDE